MRLLIILLFFISLFSCQNDDNQEGMKSAKKTVFRFIDKTNTTNTDAYEKAEFCLRVNYPKENYTKFINDFIYTNNVPETLDYIVPGLYDGCIYEYRIFLSNRSWNASKKSKEYRFSEISMDSFCDSVIFEYPEDTINAIEVLEIDRE